MYDCQIRLGILYSWPLTRLDVRQPLHSCVAQYNQGLKEAVGYEKKDKKRIEEEVASKGWWWWLNSDCDKLQWNCTTHIL